MSYPEWVEKYRQKGTNISCIRGKYYLYEVSSKWDKEKGRAQKVTGKYLGRINEEDGLVPPKVKTTDMKSITVKEYGACSVLSELGNNIYVALKEVFPKEADRIFVLALIRVIERCPFKRAELLYQRSYLSEIYSGISLNSKSITKFLIDIGSNREKLVTFMQRFISGSEYIIFDATNIISKSDEMEINRVGYNSHRQYDPQINLLYAFSCEPKQPVYYRVFPGNIREISALKLSVEETQLHDMIIVADKGFGSQANFDLLDEYGLKYIVPLRRNNTLFDKSVLQKGTRDAFGGYFMYNDRVIWHYSTTADGKNIYTYLDNELKNREEKDYILRIEKQYEGYSKEGFFDKQYDFGSIVIKTNLNKTPEEIFYLYKTRCEIEQSFDFLKNLLDLDKSYMQNQYSLEAWAFLNHISLMLSYKLLNLLRDKKLLSKYSVSDLIFHFKYIHKVKVNNQWVTSEISGKTSKLLTSLDLHIT